MSIYSSNQNSICGIKDEGGINPEGIPLIGEHNSEAMEYQFEQKLTNKQIYFFRVSKSEQNSILNTSATTQTMSLVNSQMLFF